MTFASLSPSPRPEGRFRRYAPLPFVAISVLLVVVILVTPVLVSEGQPAPGILTQAELIVDRISGNGTLHVYVRGLGSTVRYAEIWFGSSTNFSWSGAGTPPWASMGWSTWTNLTFVLGAFFASSANPVAVNVTAHYVSAGGSASYTAVVAFFVGPSPSGGGISLFAASPTPGLAVAASTPVGNATLPLTILMPETSSGGVP